MAETVKIMNNPQTHSSLDGKNLISGTFDFDGCIIESFYTLFCTGLKQIKFINPLVLPISKSESGRYLVIQDEQLGINVIAATRDELIDELCAELSMLWAQSQMHDRKLGRILQLQKKHLLAIIDKEST